MDGLDLYREEKYEYVILTWPVTEIWHKGVQPLAGRGSKFSNQWPTHTHTPLFRFTLQSDSLSFVYKIDALTFQLLLFSIHYISLHYTTHYCLIYSNIPILYPHHHTILLIRPLITFSLSLSLSKWTGHSQYNFWEIYSWSLYLFKFLMIYMYDLSKTVSFWEVLWLRNQKKKKERRQHEEEH